MSRGTSHERSDNTDMDNYDVCISAGGGSGAYSQIKKQTYAISLLISVCQCAIYDLIVSVAMDFTISNAKDPPKAESFFFVSDQMVGLRTASR